MTLTELRSGYLLHDAVWTYDLAIPLTDIQYKQLEQILHNLLQNIESMKIEKQEQLQLLFSQVVTEFEIVVNHAPLDDYGIYNYGGLNNFFAEIAEVFGFPVKRGVYGQISNFVYPNINLEDD